MRQYDLFHRRGIESAAAHEMFVKGSQCGETQLDGRATIITPSERAKVSTEIELIEFQPGRRLIAFGGVPVGEFVKGLTVIALGVHRCARLGLQVLQE